ncbi:4'-phosphopantetheinyl transferase family protein [Mariniblastus fucicola]|uniref:4'-phosphopantetheinyl transferase family protein n=1 Tax=Mariniblastus fucicola TaxID=980251 RepID=UPI0012F7C456|nr:4'-phosphopantetheinyl transferase superfamily protein [Mariniblastus fucicola]
MTSSETARVKRQREFALGRRCAESLLKKLGNAEQVWTNSDRSPAWPQGFAGSISHSTNWTWAAVVEQSEALSVGVDTESIVTAETRDRVLFEIAADDEWKICKRFDLSAEQMFTLVFSAKEAFFKCCYPQVKQFFGFEHAVVDAIGPNSIRIATHPTHPRPDLMPNGLEVFYLVTQNDVLTATWLEAV